MQIRRLPADEDAVRRETEELWLPYHRELEATVENHALVDDVPLDEEVEFRLDLLESEGYRAWVVVDTDEDATDEDIADEVVTDEDSADEDVPDEDVANTDLADVDGEFVGFVMTKVDESPPVFDRPDRLIIGDIYVREAYRGTGLARDLIDRAVERARETGCEELALDVDVDNERALAFYEKLGFEPRRHRMRVPVDEL